jgi:hypothetical protein
MRMHLYIVVDCRTPGCGMMHALKYVGEKGKTAEQVPVTLPSPLWIHCPKCDLNHDFSSADLRLIEREEPPPSDFEDKI